MANEHHHTEFEQWLREETDRHRLYADESVWSRIQNRLQRRRWLPFVLTTLLIISGSVTWVMIDQPDLPINYASTIRNTSLTAPSGERIASSSKDPKKNIAPLRTNQYSANPSVLAFLMQAATEKPADVATTTTILESELASNSPEPTRIEAASIPAMVSNQAISYKPIISPVETIAVPTQPTAISKLETSVETNTAPRTPEQYLSIESVINTYKGKRTRQSWKMQFSVSPTISYRQLIENTQALQAARSVMNPAPALAAPELETVVNHKPDLGLQFGLLVNRSVTKRLDLIGGLQFNINKYDIRAYAGSREVATVGLTNGGGTGSVSSYTNYRSSGGAWANWLANFYFSVSAPVGFQYRLAGNKKWSWGIGSTLQPTYILSNQAYILSTDYKNYLEIPSLVRRWNLNSQIETFIGFQHGKTRWTLGPQARYQLLSSYEKAYPVREHLFDVGVKLGVGL